MDERVVIRGDGVALLHLAGKLNMVSAGAVRQRIAAIVAAGNPRVAVDLSEVDFIDSSGLGALISGLKSTREAGGDLQIAGPTEQARLVLSLTGMERVLTPHPNTDSTFA